MPEILAIPSWNAPPATVEAWVARLIEAGASPRVAREDGMTWIELPALRVRGFVSIEGAHVEAIDFEVHDPASALALLESAAVAMGWELHEDDGEDDGDDP